MAVNRGLFDVELVDDMIALPIITWWEKMKPIYLEGRKQFPLFGDDLEAAYHKLKPRRDQQVALARQQQATISPLLLPRFR